MVRLIPARRRRRKRRIKTLRRNKDANYDFCFSFHLQ
jgi:hypothetical protein